jgi:DNA adenine methylase
MIISYFGGKNKQSKFIFSHITEEMKKNTKTFTEVFSGAFWVYANEDWSFCDRIIYNDMNSYITNLFACCREPKFIEYLQKQYEPGNLLYFDKDVSTDLKEVYDYNYAKFKEIFLKYRKELYHDTDGQEINITPPDFDMAFKYGFMLRHAFSGIPSKKIGYSYSASSYKPGMKKVPEPKSQILLRNIIKDKVQDKLKKVTAFESLDFEEHIKKYDSPETVFYVDPPYFQHEDNYFRGEENFGINGHKRLADVLSKIQGKFLLSYYAFDELYEYYPTDKFVWKEKEFNRPTTSCAKNEEHDKKGYEVLIMNYDPDEISKSTKENLDDFWC